MRHPLLLVAGALCGILWWGVSSLLGAKAYGIWGTHASTGLLAGIATGIVTAALSAPIYRRLSVKSLYWYSPLSVYLSVAMYGLVIFVLRILLDDFHPNQIPWAVGLQSIFGMWWGITMILPFAVAVQALAYLNHRVLRKILVAA
jgi:uncharacterized membrane protein YeaQ/YmgE (transglycosylase-associated protein family)